MTHTHSIAQLVFDPGVSLPRIGGDRFPLEPEKHNISMRLAGDIIHIDDNRTGAGYIVHLSKARWLKLAAPEAPKPAAKPKAPAKPKKGKTQ